MSERADRCRCLGFVVILLCAAVPACTTLTSKQLKGPQSHVTHANVPHQVASTVDFPADRYLSHIAYLANDELGGRGTGSDGIDLAAGYIAGQFAAAGLAPGGPSGTYFQEFELNRSVELLDTTKLDIEGCDATAALRDDFNPFGFSAPGDFSGELVFVGYGITNPDQGYDDYAGVDVAGRVVLMLRREPPGWNPQGGYTNHARFDTKIELAAKKKATAVLIVNQEPGEGGIDALMRFRSNGENYGLPALHIKRALAEKIVTAGGGASLTALQKRLDAKGGHASASLPGIRVKGTVAYEARNMVARNVIGLLPGTGPHSEQYVVIGGHYDHLGTRRGRIYNGADDNASGTAGVIELARALSNTDNRDRSVIFMTFTGEEIGLRGSRYYVDNPTVPLDSIIAMINMDMIGRLNNDDEANELAIQGLGTGDLFKAIVARRTKEMQIPYLPDDSARGPSDHVSFYNSGVPSLFFFTGVHEDYHQPGDDVEKINAQGAAQVVDLVYRIALDLINGPASPQFAEVTERARIFRGARSSPGGVVMGIIPDVEDESDEPGWRIASVFPGSGADKAGMQPDDRILRVGTTTIRDFSDYREATRDKKPGDIVDVVVRRGSKELTLKVELSARRG